MLRELDQRLPPLAEKDTWLISEEINETGVPLDVPLVKAALGVAGSAVLKIDEKMAAATEGKIARVTLDKQIKAWIVERGCELPVNEKGNLRLDKGIIKELLTKADLPGPVWRVIEIRQEGARAATKKLDAMLKSCSADGRVRGALKYHGAHTGRWTSHGPQFQNLKKPKILSYKKPEEIEAAVTAVMSEKIENVESINPDVLGIIGDLTRSMIMAEQGKIFMADDFSAVEDRGAGWLADEPAILEAWEKYDARDENGNRLGPHRYFIAASQIYNCSPKQIIKDTNEYGAGKTSVLAGNYQGWIDAWRKFDGNTRTDEEIVTILRAYRASLPHLTYYWKELEYGAVEAVDHPGKIIPCKKAAFKTVGTTLLLRRPSGLKIYYQHARIEDGQVVFSRWVKKKWVDCALYGGFLMENLTQSHCRDLLVEAIKRVRAAGYPLILTVHDEVVCEVPEGSNLYTEEGLRQLMIVRPSWAKDMPLDADGWTGRRFRK